LLFHAESFCQLPVPAAKPCNDAELLKITGQWVKNRDKIMNETINLSKPQQLEVVKRIETRHQFAGSLPPFNGDKCNQ
jgi:hypothetical protein